MTGLWVVLGTLVLGTVAGLVLRSREGRIRTAKAAGGAADAEGTLEHGLPSPVAAELSAEHRVTLLQISTTFCSPCRHAHARLEALAERTEGLHHADLDVTHQPEVAHQLGVMRTPTTIAYDSAGRELLRVGGVPDTTTLLAALEAHLALTPGS